MRHARLLFPALILTGFLTSQCSLFDSKNSDDDDDGGDGGAGQSGEGSTKGGSAGTRGGTTSKGGTGSSGKGGSGTGGNDGGTTSVGGSSKGGNASGGDGNTGALGGTNPGSGGDVASGGTGGSGESGGTGGSLGGSDGAGGSTGGTGTGGTGTGGSGTAGTGGGTSCGAGEGRDLVIEAGEDAQSAWIDGSGNCFGVQGALYPVVDEVGSTMTITDTDGRICVQGVATQVLSGDFANYWGARLVVQLNNDGAGALLTYDAVAHGFDGVRFTLTGTSVPDEIRPTYFNPGSASMYCKRVCATGSQSILLSEAHVDCWEGETGSTPTGTMLERLEFSIPSNALADVTYAFCIEDLAVIDDGLTVGEPGVCPETGGPDSCYGLCGGEATNCYCDELCLDDLTGCCADFEAVCLAR